MKWQKGDLALCLKIGGWVAVDDRSDITLWGPVAGRVYVVEAVHNEFLEFDEFSDFWHNSRFTKVTPPEADEFDRETIELYSKNLEPVS